MARTRSPYLAFVADFVDSVTVRPFMHDLKRMKDHPQIFMPLPKIEHEYDEALELALFGRTAHSAA